VTVEHSSRGVPPSAVCLSVILILDNVEALAHQGLSRHKIVDYNGLGKTGEYIRRSFQKFCIVRLRDQ